ncbi:MAG: hypothetical protein IPM11_10430 [Micropruina sp.]|nr:hypothetical protein [Micropruina sp.]
MSMWRRGLVAALVALLTAVGVATPAAAAPAAATALTLSASVPGPVVATGRLTASGRPLAGASVAVRLGNAASATAMTGADGTFSATIPVPNGMYGRSSLTASFNGAAKLISSSITIAVTLPAAPAPAPEPPPAQTAPAPVPAQAGMLGSAIRGLSTDATAASGGLFGMSGQLMDANGSPIGGADIEASLAGTSVAGAITDGSGNWQLYVPVPTTGATLSVTLTYLGDSSHSGTRVTNSYAITAVSTATPTMSLPTQTPTMSVSASPLTSSVTPTATGLVDPATVTQTNSLIIGAVAVVVLILATISILVFGGRMRQGRGRRGVS